MYIYIYVYIYMYIYIYVYIYIYIYVYLTLGFGGWISTWLKWFCFQGPSVDLPEGTPKRKMSRVFQIPLYWSITIPNFIWLVVGPPLWKIWKSIGMIIPNIWENAKNGNQSTNQLLVSIIPKKKSSNQQGFRSHLHPWASAARQISWPIS